MRTRGFDIAPVFAPSSIAVIGASERPGSLGTVVFRNLLDAGFKGPVIPVNPDHEIVQGLACYGSIAEVDQEIELAVIVAPASAIPGIVDDCGARGIRSAIILSAGFSETGQAGRALQDELVRAARRHSLRFVGPNCLGVMRPASGLNASFSQTMPVSGPIALVSQSGAMCTAMLDWAAPRGIGFSCVISSGIAADIDFGEILDYLLADSETAAIMLYVEGIRDARRFMGGLRAASRVKPVIVMKAGRFAEGRKAAISHSGSLAGADDVFDAALRRSGVVRVQRYADFFAIAETLNTGVKTVGPRLAIVTNGGGPGVMAADFLVDRHLPLAELSEPTMERLSGRLPASWSRGNPVDVLGDAGADRYAFAVAACLDDDKVDSVLAIAVPQAMTDPTSVAEAVAKLAESSKKPVFTCWMGDVSMAASRKIFRKHGIPTYSTPDIAVTAFAAAAAHSANQELLLQVPEPLSPAARPDTEGARLIIENALASDRRVLDVVESKALLAAFGIAVVRSVPARSASEAVALAEEIGFPVAMKVHSRDITHKSDADGVRLGIANGRDVRATWDEIVASVSSRRPDARIDGILIEPMSRASDGRELMVGVLHDETFGPVVGIGLGGTMVEVIRDRAIGLPPLNRLLARNMIEDTRASMLLHEFRGHPPASQRAIEDCILRVSDMVCELPWIEELDINPLVVDEHRAIALDARVIVRPVSPAARPYSHMAIHPYPVELVAEHILPDGTQLTIRPIRPEDATLEREFVDGLSVESRYLRFMYSMNRITPQLVSRFTQIDYDREMALIALMKADGADRQIGVARFVISPDWKSCEFAIVVADDWHNRGVATELLRKLIEIARNKGLEEMVGVTLRRNRGMLSLAREVGFETRPSPEDSQTIDLSLQLRDRH